MDSGSNIVVGHPTNNLEVEGLYPAAGTCGQFPKTFSGVFYNTISVIA